MLQSLDLTLGDDVKGIEKWSSDLLRFWECTRPEPRPIRKRQIGKVLNFDLKLQSHRESGGLRWAL